MKKKKKVKKLSKRAQSLQDIIYAYEDWVGSLTDRQYRKLENAKNEDCRSYEVVDTLNAVSALVE